MIITRHSAPLGFVFEQLARPQCAQLKSFRRALSCEAPQRGTYLRPSVSVSLNFPDVRPEPVLANHRLHRGDSSHTADALRACVLACLRGLAGQLHRCLHAASWRSGFCPRPLAPRNPQLGRDGRGRLAYFLTCPLCALLLPCPCPCVDCFARREHLIGQVGRMTVWLWWHLSLALSLRRHVGWTGERFIESPLDVATEKWRARLRNNGEHLPDLAAGCVSTVRGRILAQAIHAF